MHVQYTWSRIRPLTVNDHSFDVEQATAETTFEKKARHSGTNSQLNDQVCCPFTKLEMRRMLEVAYGMIRKYHFGYEIRNAFTWYAGPAGDFQRVLLQILGKMITAKFERGQTTAAADPFPAFFFYFFVHRVLRCCIIIMLGTNAVYIGTSRAAVFVELLPTKSGSHILCWILKG